MQLKKLEGFNSRRRENAELLSNGIRNIRGLTVPYVDKNVKHVFHQYVIRVVDSYPLSRDELAAHLTKNGIGNAVHYPIPIYRQPLYLKLGYREQKCPNTEEACRQVLSLPVHPVVSREDIEYMLAVLKDVS
jgi:perosamine synthetase